MCNVFRLRRLFSRRFAARFVVRSLVETVFCRDRNTKTDTSLATLQRESGYYSPNIMKIPYNNDRPVRIVLTFYSMKGQII